MENWENKIIGEKLNSLVNLPEGYNPDLLSKWEIIAAGSPNQKRKIAPLLKWAIAAAIISAVFYITTVFFSTNKNQLALKLQPYNTSIATIVTALNKQPDKTENLVEERGLKYKKNKRLTMQQTPLLAKKETKKVLIETIIPVLNNISANTIPLVQPTEPTNIIAVTKIEITNHAKAKIFQKDFADDVLTMDKPTKTTSEHAGLKIRFNKNVVEENGQSSPALQWKKSF